MNNRARQIRQELCRAEEELQRAHSPIHVRRLLERIQDLRLQLKEIEGRHRRDSMPDFQQVAGEVTANLLTGLILFGVLRDVIEGKQQAQPLSSEEEQQRIDAIAAELLADVDLRF